MEFEVEDTKDKFEILKAFISFQKEVKSPKKNKTNPFAKNKYADLQSVTEEAERALEKAGLSLTQEFVQAEDKSTLSVQTELIHEKGILKFSKLTVPIEKKTSQGIGSAITYARRYSLSANLGMVAEDDDDGNAASQSSGRSQNNYGNNYSHSNSNYKNRGKNNYPNKNTKPSNNYHHKADDHHSSEQHAPTKRDELNKKRNGWFAQYKQVTGQSAKAIYEQAQKDCGVDQPDALSDKDYEQFIKFLVSELQKGMSDFAKKKGTSNQPA